MIKSCFQKVCLSHTHVICPIFFHFCQLTVKPSLCRSVIILKLCWKAVRASLEESTHVALPFPNDTLGLVVGKLCTCGKPNPPPIVIWCSLSRENSYQKSFGGSFYCLDSSTLPNFAETKFQSSTFTFCIYIYFQNLSLSEYIYSKEASKNCHQRVMRKKQTNCDPSKPQRVLRTALMLSEKSYSSNAISQSVLANQVDMEHVKEL